jgi:hypothetical protein
MPGSLPPLNKGDDAEAGQIRILLQIDKDGRNLVGFHRESRTIRVVRNDRFPA